MSEFTQLLVFLVALPPSYLLLRALYRITFHPLCAFPGPKLRAISHLPHAYYGSQGIQAVAVRDLHRQYGEVVRIAPDLLSFMTPSSWKDIHGHAASKKFPKFGYFKVRADAQPLLTAEDKDYPRQRAALSHGFSDRAIAGQEWTLKKQIDVFIKKLGEKASAHEVTNMSEWFSWLTFDIVGEFTLSMKFGCVESGENHPWVSTLVKWFRATSFAANANAFGIFAPFVMLFANIKDLMGIKIHLQRSAEKVRERLEQGEVSGKADIWSYVLRAQGDKSLTMGEMEVNAAALLVAATAPVSDTLSGAVYLLAKNRDKLVKLREEVDGLAKSEEDITMVLTGKMTYLMAVINESLRCYTPTPGGGRRKAPPEGATVSGYFVPGGTIVCVYQLPAFTLPNNFALPETFLPERWLPADHPDRPNATLSDKQEVFQPFSVGPKACLGKGMALAEIKFILARLVWHFDFELVDNGFAFEKQRAFLFRERPALNVQLAARNR
ncbi:cytochrome P450 4F3 omega-hydroxylase [Melanomma pulvis-pyrius CBS 109.77]|uniref:Cytochrome P450 4F3 omega-hydroxylase n=1 Tax=Melanomma pulvis-pyrius CBS 109.77 TaxID=1314802 RepID=A0A6A6X6X6_9PLEO|nr:cytochrome P450 4F3 omega-hydroxylase [Melanomma pulvis-pyrius CBS 109.77]